MSEINTYLETLREPDRKIVLFLHQYLTTEFDLEFKIRYRVPFYFKKSWVCYLNPQKSGGIEMAFLRGNELSNIQGILDFKSRIQVAGLTIKDIKNIAIETINEIVHEAIILDESVPYKSKNRTKK